MKPLRKINEGESFLIQHVFIGMLLLIPNNNPAVLMCGLKCARCVFRDGINNSKLLFTPDLPCCTNEGNQSANDVFVSKNLPVRDNVLTALRQTFSRGVICSGNVHH